MKSLKIYRWRDGEIESLRDRIAKESILHLEIGSEFSMDIIITPEHIREFVYGNLFSEGFIKSVDDVEGYYERMKGEIISVKIRLKDGKRLRFKKNYNIVWTECGSDAKIIKESFKKIESNLKIRPEQLIQIPDRISESISLFKMTGAYHFAFIFNDALELENHCYDIGRHNAVDKVIGTRLIDGKKFKECILYSTGRISSDIVVKCLRAGIPFIVSKSAPLTTAVEIARRYNLGLIGFLRGKRFNIYNGIEMIEE